MTKVSLALSQMPYAKSQGRFRVTHFKEKNKRKMRGRREVDCGLQGQGGRGRRGRAAISKVNVADVHHEHLPRPLKTAIQREFRKKKAVRCDWLSWHSAGDEGETVCGWMSDVQLG